MKVGRIDGPPALVKGYPLWQVDMKVVPVLVAARVFDKDGRLAGVVRGRFRGTESRGFLIPVGTIQEFLDQGEEMKFGRYEILEEIGKGSMGVVYKALDPNLDLVVALKVLRQDRLDNEPFVRRFVAEAKALGRLDHANIVRVFNVDREQDRVYLVMEFVEGESFAKHMQELRSNPAKIAEFGATIAEALDNAHQKGIVPSGCKARQYFDPGGW